MLTIAWNDRYLIGIPMIDNQHKYLLQLLNTLYADYASNQDTEYLAALFDNLIAYASYHFALEERWMIGQQYPLLPEHKKEHATFSAQVKQMQLEYGENGKDVSLQAITFLYHWLTDHIQGSDFNFGCFIRRKDEIAPECTHTQTGDRQHRQKSACSVPCRFPLDTPTEECI